MDTNAALTTLIDNAGLLGLDIRPEWRAAVLAQLQASLRLAMLVSTFPLPDAAEPAPVFVA